MSATMISIGQMAVLVTPRDYEADAEDLAAKGLCLNYEGTLVYNLTTDVESSDFDGLHIVNIDESRRKFLLGAYTANLAIEDGLVKPFFCHWHTGSDSPMATITKEEFLES